MPIKHTYTATGTNDPAKQVSVDRWNEGHTLDGELVMPSAIPATPAAGDLAIFNRPIAGRAMLSQLGPSGLDTSLQPNFGGNKIALWMPPGNGTTMPGVFGFVALTTIGTAATRTIATTNLLTRMTRIGYVSATTVGSLAGHRESLGKFTVGAGGGLGGFFYRARFGVSDAATVSGSRMFLGLGPSVAPTNVEVDTLVNVIGVCDLSTQTTLHIYAAGATATTPINLGANFPVRAGSLDAYELALFAAANSGDVKYQVTRLNTGDVATGTISSNLPSGTTLLNVTHWRCNNATALAVGLDICGIYMETDY